MDPILALTMFVICLVLWTYVPKDVRSGLGPLVHTLADAVRAIARPAWRATYALLCRLYSVNTSEEVPAHPTRQNTADVRTNGRTDVADVVPLACRRLKVDRTRAALVDVLVYNGWTVTDARKVLKGENAAFAAEWEAAQERTTSTRYISDLREECGVQ